MAKNGYVTLDFNTIDSESKQIKSENKKTFIVTMKTVGEILDLNTRDQFNPNLDSEGTYVQY